MELPTIKEIKENPRLIARYIDHTNVNPNSTSKHIKQLIKEAKKYKFHSVVVLPYYAPLAKRLLGERSGIKVCTVIGFPFGVQATEAKIKEVEKVFDYVDEFDMVMNRPGFKNKDYKLVLEDIKAVVKTAKGKIVKVIIESPELTSKEIEKATRIVLKSGAHFVKTAVGLKGPAKISHVRLMKRVVKDKIKIKASGGIRDFETALKFIKAGASRIGASHSIDIILSAFKKGVKKRKGYFHE